jgi:hypothetical protein
MKQPRILKKVGREGMGQGDSRGLGRTNDEAASRAGSVSPDLWGRSWGALTRACPSWSSVANRAKESAAVGDEEEVLRQGIRMPQGGP